MPEIMPITTDWDLKQLAKEIEKAHQNADFMTYLLERPMAADQIYETLQTRVQNWWAMFGITHHDQMVWYNLYFTNDKSYIADQKWAPDHWNGTAKAHNLELSFRILPSLQSKGVCTQAVAASLHHLFELQPDLQQVEWRHSVYNKWSYHVFRRCGFTLTNYVPEGVNLPNRDPDGTKTDIFGRTIHRNDLHQRDIRTTISSWNDPILPKIIDQNKREIIEALKFHNIIPEEMQI